VIYFFLKENDVIYICIASLRDLSKTYEIRDIIN